MRSINTIFIKQARDTFRNPMVLVQFILFPVVALIMTEMIAKADPGIPDSMFVSMMAAVFAGMGLIASASGIIAEDIEKKSLRLLVMAGVKPYQYLLGTAGFILLAGQVVNVVFTLIGGFNAQESVRFAIVLGLSICASILLGATIGMLSKNQQAATSVGMPVAIVIGFVPMIANFNETVANATAFLYTQQLNVIINDFSGNFTKAILVICANIAVLLVAFIVAYKKKGLK